MAAQSHTPLKPFLLASILNRLPRWPFVILPSDSRDGMCPGDPMNRSGAAIHSTRAASSGSTWITTRNRIYPAFQPTISILDNHYHINPSSSQPAEHGFAGLSTAHRLLAGRPSKEGQGRPT